MTNGDNAVKEVATKANAITFTKFLESVHPGKTQIVTNLSKEVYGNHGKHKVVNIPDIRIHCVDKNCGGIRTFRSDKELVISSRDNVITDFILYTCSDCQRSKKYFSIHINLDTEGVTKFGEIPSFGVPVPNKLLRLFGHESALFLKGRQSENQALGIGAFAYYRRVVEHHKDKLFEEIIKVCSTLGASPELMTSLTAAKGMVSFSAAVDSLKIALPDGLFIDGHNPLKLLHSALSEGLHNESDEDCLELAHSIRVVLAELVERISQLRKDDQELTNAVKRLMQPKT